jgi:hypothetical protein
MLALVSVLQYAENLTDRQAAMAARCPGPAMSSPAGLASGTQVQPYRRSTPTGREAAMADQSTGGGCTCCAPAPTDDTTGTAAVRARFLAGAEQPGITGAALTGQAAGLQAAAGHLAAPARAGACDPECACLSATSAVTAPKIPLARTALTLTDAQAQTAEPEIVCTLGGGTEAMRERVAAWQAVLAPAGGRQAVEGGLRLAYAHDAAVAVELARLAAAEFACCSFFTFTLGLGPGGMTFTATAPQAAQELVTALFGTADTPEAE